MDFRRERIGPILIRDQLGVEGAPRVGEGASADGEQGVLARRRPSRFDIYADEAVQVFQDRAHSRIVSQIKTVIHIHPESRSNWIWLSDVGKLLVTAGYILLKN
jgi:hypothetical protein